MRYCYTTIDLRIREPRVPRDEMLRRLPLGLEEIETLTSAVGTDADFELWQVSLADTDPDGPFDEAMRGALELLRPHHAAIHWIQERAVEVYLYVGIFHNRQKSVASLDPGILRELAQLGLKVLLLSYDSNPGDDE